MWTGVYLSGRVNFFSVFYERQRDIFRRCVYSQGFAKAVHMSNDTDNFDLAKTSVTAV